MAKFTCLKLSKNMRAIPITINLTRRAFCRPFPQSKWYSPVGESCQDKEKFYYEPTGYIRRAI
jgi:hypothetical protein